MDFVFLTMSCFAVKEPRVPAILGGATVNCVKLFSVVPRKVFCAETVHLCLVQFSMSSVTLVFLLLLLFFFLSLTMSCFALKEPHVPAI